MFKEYRDPRKVQTPSLSSSVEVTHRNTNLSNFTRGPGESDGGLTWLFVEDRLRRTTAVITQLL